MDTNDTDNLKFKMSTYYDINIIFEGQTFLNDTFESNNKKKYNKINYKDSDEITYKNIKVLVLEIFFDFMTGLKTKQYMELSFEKGIRRVRK